MPDSLITPRSARRVTGMVRIAPVSDLVDVVEQHWVVSWDRRGLPALRHEVLSDPSINLTVEPAGRLLYGPGSGRSVHELTGTGIVIGTKFRAGAFSGYWPGPVSALTGRVVALPDAFGPAGARLDAALMAAIDINSILAAVSNFLRTRRPPPDPHRALTIEIVEAMRAASPGARVVDLAADFAISSRTLQRLFARHVGVSPKQVLQRFRRQLAADRLNEHSASNLGRLAAELGYFDQAHLARDFRETLGRSPSAVAASD
ncbi:MAG: helix-turn-helix domain-containing protein [Solirubrobacteraceae bacterium]